MGSDSDGTRDVHTKLLDERIDRALERHFSKGCGGDGSDNLIGRLERVEHRIGEIEKKLERIESQMAKAIDLAELKGRIPQLPTVWQLSGLILAIFGMAFALLRFGLPHS